MSTADSDVRCGGFNVITSVLFYYVLRLIHRVIFAPFPCGARAATRITLCVIMILPSHSRLPNGLDSGCFPKQEIGLGAHHLGSHRHSVNAFTSHGCIVEVARQQY